MIEPKRRAGFLTQRQIEELREAIPEFRRANDAVNKVIAEEIANNRRYGPPRRATEGLAP